MSLTSSEIEWQKRRSKVHTNRQAHHYKSDSVIFVILLVLVVALHILPADHADSRRGTSDDRSRSQHPASTSGSQQGRSVARRKLAMRSVDVHGSCSRGILSVEKRVVVVRRVRVGRRRSGGSGSGSSCTRIPHDLCSSVNTGIKKRNKGPQAHLLSLVLLLPQSPVLLELKERPTGALLLGLLLALPVALLAVLSFTGALDDLLENVVARAQEVELLRGRRRGEVEVCNGVGQPGAAK